MNQGPIGYEPTALTTELRPHGEIITLFISALLYNQGYGEIENSGAAVGLSGETGLFDFE